MDASMMWRQSEIFTQMDGMPSALHNGGLMMVLATTNCPWDLDEGAP